MEYVNAALIIIGFLIIGYYQKQKIGALEKQLNSQKEIIGNTKAFFDLFDLEKLKGYGDVIEKKVRTEMECQMAEFKSALEKKQGEVREAMSNLFDEYIDTIHAMARSLIYLSMDRRTNIIDGMREGIAKRVLGVVSKEMDDIVLEARTAALKALSEASPIRHEPT